MYEVILALAVVAPALSHMDEYDAVMYVQSRITPKLLEACKVAATNVPASEYVRAYEKWL